jgi:hypothetical protein
MNSVRSLPVETPHPSLRHLLTLGRFTDALSKGELFRLNMGLLKAANATSLQWVDVEKAPYAAAYQPVMALAQNHVFFLNVPGTAAGSADIYVIHCESSSYSSRWTFQNLVPDDYFQPAPQPFPAPTGTIPATHGQTASFFQENDVRGIIRSTETICLTFAPGAKSVRVRSR